MTDSITKKVSVISWKHFTGIQIENTSTFIQKEKNNVDTQISAYYIFNVSNASLLPYTLLSGCMTESVWSYHQFISTSKKVFCMKHKHECSQSTCWTAKQKKLDKAASHENKKNVCLTNKCDRSANNAVVFNTVSILLHKHWLVHFIHNTISLHT